MLAPNYIKNISELFLWTVLFVLYPSMLFMAIAPLHKLIILILPLLYLSFVDSKLKHKTFIFSSFICLMYLVGYPLINDEMTGDAITIIGRMCGCIMAVLLLIKLDIKRQINVFISIIVVISVFNLISSLLVLVLNSDGVILVEHKDRVLKLFYFTLSAVEISFSSFKIIKGAGIFDEPGALSFFIFVAILLNNLKSESSKKTEALLIACGLVTLSLAFIVVTTLYLFLSKGRLSIVRVALAGLLIITSLLMLKSYNEIVYDNFYKLTIGRVLSNDVNEDGRSVTNTRGHINKVSLELIQEKPLFGFGIQHALEYSQDYGSASILATLAGRGVIGSFLFFMPIICMVLYPLKSIKRFGSYKPIIIYLMTVFLFLLCFSQRPFLSLPLNFVCVFLLYHALCDFLYRENNENIIT